MKKISLLMFLILCLAAFAACSTIMGENEPGDELIPLPGSSFAEEQAFEGAPNQGFFSVDGGYFIWKNGNTFSVRTANPARNLIPIPAPFYTGNIQVEGGTIERVRRHNIGSFDDIGSRMTALDFRIELKRAASGFDFEIRPMRVGYCVLFDLRYNGESIPGIVHLGRTLLVPGALPLNICFH